MPGKERVVPVFLPNEEKRSRPTIQLTPDCNQITKGKEKHKRKIAEQSSFRVAEVGARKCRAFGAPLVGIIGGGEFVVGGGDWRMSWCWSR